MSNLLNKIWKNRKNYFKCHHKICRDCLFNSIDNKLYSCPMCRKPIFPVSNANANANLPEEHIENDVNDVNMEL